MCGIAGIVDLVEGPPLGETLRRMAAALAHRGPDAEGLLEDRLGLPAVGLAHRRLSIIDLSEAADQPLANEDASIHALLNGEIYNFGELRQHLAVRHAFRSRGDTEAIVHGYEEKGDEVVRELDGMFALAVWDARRRRLLLARDRLGKKPLFYWSDSRRFVFGSEIKALFAAGVPAVFAEENLLEYLAFGAVPSPRTLFRGVLKLPPAATLVVDRAGVGDPKPYWELHFPRAGSVTAVPAAEAAERVAELLAAAVRKRLVADVPLGVLLSGGLDSSLIAAATVEHASGRLRTFTVGFEAATPLDERRHARTVASHLGTEHTEIVVRPEAAGLIETLVHHYDEPFGDASALPTYLVAREARRHVTVALNGDGGDEAFAGYGHFGAALLAERLPARLIRSLRHAIGPIPKGGERSALSRLQRFLHKADRPFEERILAWTTHFDVPVLRELAGRDGFDQARLLQSYRGVLDGASFTSPLARLLLLNLKTYLLDDLLPKMDRMTMAHGLEARSPFLDTALVTYAATLPDAAKRRGMKGKLLLRPIADKLLPRSVARRGKQGFGVPVGDWFRGELRPMIEDLLLERPVLGRYLRADVVRRLHAEHLARHADRGAQLWTLLTLELWLRRHRFG